MINVKAIFFSLIFIITSSSAFAGNGEGRCIQPRHFTVIGSSVLIESVEIKTPKPDFSVIKTSDHTFDVFNDSCDRRRYGAVALNVIDADNPNNDDYTQDTSKCEILGDSSFLFSKRLKMSNSQPYCEFSNVLRTEKSIA